MSNQQGNVTREFRGFLGFSTGSKSGHVAHAEPNKVPQSIPI